MIETSVMKKLKIYEGSENSFNGRTFLSNLFDRNLNTPLVLERFFMSSYYHVEKKVSFYTNSTRKRYAL